MYQTYQKLFARYLDIIQRDGNQENLKEKCKKCMELKSELHGMLVLLLQTEEITTEEYEQECERILNSFSTIELFRAYLPYGDVFTY